MHPTNLDSWPQWRKIEREIYRPGYFVIQGIVAGFLIGASLVGLCWLISTEGTTATGSTGNTGSYEGTKNPPDQNSW